jgi:hypothetical protein
MTTAPEPNRRVPGFAQYNERRQGDDLQFKPVQYLFMLKNIATYKHEKAKITHFYWISGGSAFGNPMF